MHSPISILGQSARHDTANEYRLTWAGTLILNILFNFLMTKQSIMLWIFNDCYCGCCGCHTNGWKHVEKQKLPTASESFHCYEQATDIDLLKFNINWLLSIKTFKLMVIHCNPHIETEINLRCVHFVYKYYHYDLSRHIARELSGSYLLFKKE